MKIASNNFWLIMLMAACSGENTILFHPETEDRNNRCEANISFERHPVLYVTAFDTGTCVVYQLDIKTHCCDPIYLVADSLVTSPKVRPIFDPCSGYFFIADESSSELWMTMLPGECPLFFCGKLGGPQKCACFLNGYYYYVNKCTQTLNVVRFSSQWMIAGENILDTLPAGFIADGMILSPASDYLYISGRYKRDENKLISWSLADSSFHATSVKLEKTDRIAFGSDNILYAISPSPPYHLTPLSP